jgi:hypothetical protein
MKEQPERYENQNRKSNKPADPLQAEAPRIFFV